MQPWANRTTLSSQAAVGAPCPRIPEWLHRLVSTADGMSGETRCVIISN